MELRILVAGSRSFEDFETLSNVLTEFLAPFSKEKFSPVIISGTAKGADQLGEQYGIKHNIPIRRFPADWKRYGRAAGMIRNNQMLDHICEKGCVGAVVAFWDGKSKGTAHTISEAKRREVEHLHINYF